MVDVSDGSHRQDRDDVTEALRSAGARFAFVFGSVVEGRAQPHSDLDVAAWWGPAGGSSTAPDVWDVVVPPGIDLLVLDRAPLELAGRVALRGELLFEDDPVARVRWQADTRRIYFDEEDRQRRSTGSRSTQLSLIVLM